MKRKTILQNIFKNFQMMTQDIISNPNSYSKYYNEATALIELLEVEDCGSVGGFDSNNPLVYITKFTLFDRFLTLVKKENTKLEKECYFTIRTMIKYWSIIENLRESFNK